MQARTQGTRRISQGLESLDLQIPATMLHQHQIWLQPHTFLLTPLLVSSPVDQFMLRAINLWIKKLSARGGTDHLSTIMPTYTLHLVPPRSHAPLHIMAPIMTAKTGLLHWTPNHSPNNCNLRSVLATLLWTIHSLPVTQDVPFKLWGFQPPFTQFMSLSSTSILYALAWLMGSCTSPTSCSCSRKLSIHWLSLPWALGPASPWQTPPWKWRPAPESTKKSSNSTSEKQMFQLTCLVKAKRCYYVYLCFRNTRIMKAI